MAKLKSRGILGVLFGLLWAFPLHSAIAVAAPQAQLAKIAARPVLWTVRSRTATVYLFGSIHLLPANVDWHTHEIDAAIARADTFYFEAPLDDAGKTEVADFVRKNGTLPAGTTLRSLLPKKTLADYERALETVHLSAAALDNERPWLAALVLDVAYLQHMNYVVADGVDQQIYTFASAHGRAVKSFETPAEQLALFMPKDRGLELAEFDVELKEFQSEQETIGAMVDAWGTGNAKEVGRLMNKDLEGEPDAKKLLIDDRNRNWIKVFQSILVGRGTCFVTVGTGHLVGPEGVPALLRAQGYRVEGP